MNNRKQTIRKIVNQLNNKEEEGGLWLPNIQRPFVWKKEQTQKLFDSIMREYPISTFLLWKTKEEVKLRKFIDNFREGISLQSYYVLKNDKKKLVVLDGQQRLQSLYIALIGSYDGEELYFNVLSGTEEIEDTKYQFRFMAPSKALPQEGWLKLKKLVFDNRDYYTLSNAVIEEVGGNVLSNEQKEVIRRNISILTREFKDRDNILYQELDSIENPELYDLNDVVEIFIRANSGGTPLSKSDLMFSLLTVSWENIEEEIADLLSDINRVGYEFTRDFVLKTCLVLIGAGAKYDVMKFRKEKNLSEIKTSWNQIQASIRDIHDFLFNDTYIRSGKALPSYIPLIPLIYFRHTFHSEWKQADRTQLREWLFRAMVAGAFSGSSDSILDAVIKDIKDKKTFNFSSINTVIANRNRSMYITSEKLLNLSYGDSLIYLVFSLIYQGVNFQPSYEGNLPTLDHIFPQSKLKEIKISSADTHRMKMKYDQFARDQIANLMLLSRDENSNEKRAVYAEDWLASKSVESVEYLTRNFIPVDRRLWKMDSYEEFLEERKKLLSQTFENIGLIRPEAQDGTPDEDEAGSRIEPTEFPHTALARVSDYLSVSIKPEKPNSSNYMALDSSVRLVCRASREHADGSKRFFWYGFTPQNEDFLKQGTSSFVVFYCGTSERIVIIPYELFTPLLDNMGTSPQRGSTKPLRHYHVRIYLDGERLLLEQTNSLVGEDVTTFLIPS